MILMAEWLSDSAGYLEIVLNVIEAIALIVSIITVLYFMLNHYIDYLA